MDIGYQGSIAHPQTPQMKKEEKNWTNKKIRELLNWLMSSCIGHLTSAVLTFVIALACASVLAYVGALACVC